MDATTLQLAGDRPAPGLLGMAERGHLPDALLRLGIRRLCTQRLQEELEGGPEAQARRFRTRMQALARGPVAEHTDAANAQHYELPAAFFKLCLGERLKYSSCYYPNGNETLDQAEEAMLALYLERAGLADGQDILELGCGWGSLTLFMAERLPGARITAVSNSRPQREYIKDQCATRGLGNVQVLTRDANALELPLASFDRCVSVEMFEHMHNLPTLMGRIHHWLRPGGKLFVHTFAHRTLAYPFATTGDDNWMGRHFFTGGMMPSVDTLPWCSGPLRPESRWLVDGTHYQRTAEHWLQRQDAQRDAVMAVLDEAYGDAAELWYQRWRMFWMACAELFGYEGGRQWMVVHHLFGRL
ncbi:MAG: cyclopropane-fatty-acyl-phospholipid synthase family protein [Luteimonas sp.]